jgi:glycosyltransferase involved in cell wall biosynthesis
MSTANPVVSIVVNNFNYGRYLSAAIESALNQTYARCEVIVVDDGSTDDSRDVIAGFGDRVLLIFQENAGQASALNAGFARSAGEIVIFLDADDLLLPETAQRVVDAFASDPGLVRVHYRLEMVDARGAPLGRLIPRRQTPMASGDLRLAVLRYPDDLAWAAMSGNAFSAAVLRHVMPIPVARFPTVGADVYLLNVTPLFGPVLSLDAVGAHYRVHGKNAYHRDQLDLQHLRRMTCWSEATHAEIRRLATDLGLDPPAVGARSLTWLASRMIVLRLDPQGERRRGDTRLRLGLAGVSAAVRRRDRPWGVRLRYAGWFAAMPLAPRPLARWLARSFLFPKGDAGD